MDIFERIMFNRYFKTKQAVKRAEAYRDAYHYECSKKHETEKRHRFNIFVPYNPIKPSDLSLEKFLQQNPRYRQIGISKNLNNKEDKTENND